MFFVSDYETMRCFEWACTYMINVFKSYHVKSGLVHIWKIPLSHITTKVISIRVERDNKNDKTLPHNRAVFLGFEFETA